VVGSKVGRDFGRERYSWLRAHGIHSDYILESKSPTTSFVIRYTDGDRSMRLRSRCDSLTPHEIINLPSSSTLHLGPILNEISPSLAASIARREAVLSLDPQGYLRRILCDGTVRMSRWRNSSLLKKIDVLKVSEDEATRIVGTRDSSEKLLKLGPRIILLTKGRMGTRLLSKDEGTLNLPAYRTKVRDPTGAGDALVGAFLVTWVRTEDLLWSAAVGSAVASFVVQSSWPRHFGTRRGIEERATEILNGCVRG